MPRNAQGEMEGRDCLLGPLDLYITAGAFRQQLVALIEAARQSQGSE